MRTHKSNKFLSVLMVLVLILMIFAAASFIIRQYHHFEYTAFYTAETADELSNPYQGFYSIYGFRLTDQVDSFPDLEKIIFKAKRQQLVLIEINLDRYAESDISETGLQQLDDVLTEWSKSGRQIILRFLYDWDGKNLEVEPQNIDQVVSHMKQVAPIVNAHADRVYILQGIFVGNHGEMHHSIHLGDENIRYLAKQLDQLIDPFVFFAVRRPSFWRMITGVDQLPDEFPAFNGSLTSRVSLFNDGMLGSYSDLGTYKRIYVEDADEDYDPNLAGRKAELLFQYRLCEYVPNGGEVVIDNPFNDLENAIHDMQLMHISYLNTAYDANVYDKWKNTTYYGDDCFNGLDGYTYIKEHLGYRYVIQSTAIDFNTWFDDAARFYCLLENVGFASSMREMSIDLVIENAETSAIIEIPIEYDLRDLKSKKSVTLKAELPIRSYEPGRYRVYLNIAEPITGSQIMLATNLLSNEHGYFLGEFIN